MTRKVTKKINVCLYVFVIVLPSQRTLSGSMSKPILSFDLNSLDFSNKFLTSSKSTAVPPPIFNDLLNTEPDDTKKSANLSDGRSITLKKKAKKSTDVSSISIDALQKQKENYGFNINELFAKLELERLQELKTSESNSANSESYLKHDKNDVLWAEKWRPKTFMDFVGNEATNRKILKWIKQWNRVVFEKNFKPITTENANLNSRYADPFGRPDRKILLIHGPPGLGKTTVAHVIAKQAGYEVMEVNASDERSGQKVKDKINNSLSSLTFSGKPVCLIADEADGAAEFGFIKVLLDIVNDDYKTVQRYQSSEQPSKFWSQTGKNRPKFLLRPIIAICNDLYAPALEKLRGVAEIITFQQATERALGDRLKFICKAEDLTLTSQQLKEIILLTNFDIRSCLNILQFGGNLNSSNDLKKKDAQISWFSIVNQIFKRDPKQSKDEQFKQLYDTITVNNNYEKVINGCFQSYHDIHYQDIKLSKPAMISDWLFFSDLMGKTQFESIGNLSFYCCQAALQFFNQFSDLSNRSTLLIKSDYEHFEKRKNNWNIIRSINDHLKPSLRTTFKTNQFSTDILPLLDYIMTPERKTVAIMKDTDLVKAHDAIGALQAFGLSVNKGKDDNYNDIYKTYPEFTQLTRFDLASIRKQQHKQTQVFPALMKEMETLKIKKRHFAELENGGSQPVDTEAGIQSLKDQYNRLADAETLAKKQKTVVSVKIWVKYHEGFSNAVRKNVKWSNLWE